MCPGFIRVAKNANGWGFIEGYLPYNASHMACNFGHFVKKWFHFNKIELEQRKAIMGSPAMLVHFISHK